MVVPRRSARRLGCVSGKDGGVAAHDQSIGSPDYVPSVGQPVAVAGAGSFPASGGDEREPVAEPDALGMDTGRSVAFLRGRAVGAQAAKRHGPVPDHVADAIASIIAGDPAVRAAG